MISLPSRSLYKIIYESIRQPHKSATHSWNSSRSFNTTRTNFRISNTSNVLRGTQNKTTGNGPYGHRLNRNWAVRHTGSYVGRDPESSVYVSRSVLPTTVTPRPPPPRVYRNVVGPLKSRFHRSVDRDIPSLMSSDCLNQSNFSSRTPTRHKKEHRSYVSLLVVESSLFPSFNTVWLQRDLFPLSLQRAQFVRASNSAI